jgi:hypothetical protein
VHGENMLCKLAILVLICPVEDQPHDVESAFCVNIIIGECLTS